MKPVRAPDGRAGRAGFGKCRSRGEHATRSHFTPSLSALLGLFGATMLSTQVIAQTPLPIPTVPQAQTAEQRVGQSITVDGATIFYQDSGGPGAPLLLSAQRVRGLQGALTTPGPPLSPVYPPPPAPSDIEPLPDEVPPPGAIPAGEGLGSDPGMSCIGDELPGCLPFRKEPIRDPAGEDAFCGDDGAAR